MQSLLEGSSARDVQEPFCCVGPFQSLPFLGQHLAEQELQNIIFRDTPEEVEETFNGNPSQPSFSRVNQIHILSYFKFNQISSHSPLLTLKTMLRKVDHSIVPFRWGPMAHRGLNAKVMVASL